MMKSSSDIDDVIADAVDQQDTGESKFPGMSYEDEVIQALRWVTGEDDSNPMED